MRITTSNPATGEALETYEVMDRDAVLAILARTDQVWRDWRERSVADRASYLAPLASTLRENAERYARLMVLEMGKPLTEALAEIEKCAWLCEFYAEHAPGWLADEDVAADGLAHKVVYEPLGVVLSIMPWNYPFWQALRFAVPTVAAGNASLLKHASNVTGCALAMEEAFVEAGFPADLFRTVVADHATVAELVARDEIRGVSLTGSSEVGRRIAELAGRNLKKVVLELGGSDPFIVLEDADLEAAARGAVTGRMLCTGQSCIASKRFIVVESVAEAFSARFAELMAQLKVGDPLDPATQVGSVVNEQELAALENQLAEAVTRGARVITGGQRLPGVGCFFPPTVVADVIPDMRLAREEVFGPIAPVLVVPDEDAAVALANDSEFGLGGSVWTRDLARGEAVARRLESGTVFINSFTKSDPRMPFGGVKKSGLGRELGRFGLREFVNIKGLNIYGA
ncbi:MAG: NAD-dependent succinate-semialdehyde dehydrogenase [bacterium]|nr:NAD-dependent succinate-semialdehyde dehydrogenase [bacterium]